MNRNEYFEVLIEGTWKKVDFVGAALDYSIDMKWKCLQLEYGYENVRLVKEV